MRCRRVCFTRTKRVSYCWIGRCLIGTKSRRRLIAKIGSKGPPDRAARTLPQPKS